MRNFIRNYKASGFLSQFLKISYEITLKNMFFSQSHLPHNAFDQNMEADQNLNTNKKVFVSIDCLVTVFSQAWFIL